MIDPILNKLNVNMKHDQNRIILQLQIAIELIKYDNSATTLKTFIGNNSMVMKLLSQLDTQCSGKAKSSMMKDKNHIMKMFKAISNATIVNGDNVLALMDVQILRHVLLNLNKTR